MTAILGFFKVKSHLILLALLAAALTFGWVQTSRLDTANAAITSGASANKLLIERVNSDRSLIATRDALIAKQNAAVTNLVEAAKADRTAYLSRIAKADKVAVSYETNAKAILARQITTTDELQRSRAALSLIVETLAAERNPNVHP